MVIELTPRIRAIGLCIVVLALYWLLFNDEVTRLLHDSGWIYFVALSTLLIVSAAVSAPNRLATIVLWGILTPFVSSAAGYALVASMALANYDGASRLSIPALTAVALLMPYMVCGVWQLSIALPVCGLGLHYLLKHPQQRR